METDETSRRIASLRAQLGTGDHLDLTGEIVPYIDGRLDEEAKRSVEAHLASCDVCRREVAELRELAAQPRRRAWRRAIVAIAAAAAVLIVIVAAWSRRPAPTPRPVPPAQQVLAASLRDGNRIIGIDGQGALHGLSVDPETARRAASLIAHPDLAAPTALAALAAVPRTLRGPGAAAPPIEVVSPVGMAVLDTRPELAWSARAGGPYGVTITDREAMEMHGQTTTERWMPPSPLARSKIYAWQVSTTIDGARVVAPPALFRVVDEATAGAIRSASSHLVAGMLAYDAGALADARREFALLASENPSSPIPAKLIESCDRAMARR